MGRACSKDGGQQICQTLKQSGKQGEGRDQEDDQAEDGKMASQKKEGTTWNREAIDKQTMEGVDGGLHPVADGQSLSESER